MFTVERLRAYECVTMALVTTLCYHDLINRFRSLHPTCRQKSKDKKETRDCDSFFFPFVLSSHFFSRIISQNLCQINDLVWCIASSQSEVRPQQSGARCLSKLFNSVHLISLQAIMVNLHYRGLSVAVCLSSHHYRPADTQTPCRRFIDTLPSMGMRCRPAKNSCIKSLSR